MFISRLSDQSGMFRAYRFPYRLIKEKVEADLASRKARNLPLCIGRYNMQGEEYFMQTKKLDDLGFQCMERCDFVKQIDAYQDMLIIFVKDDAVNWHLVERIIRGIFCLEIMGDSAR